MKVKENNKEKAMIDNNCEIRLGVASWDKGDNLSKSVKYTWFDKNGKVARGGEVPVNALPQMIDFAIRRGFINLDFKKTI